VTRAACRDYLESRIKDVSHNALRVERGFLMPIWSRALDDGLVAANPWARVRVPGKPAPTSVTFWTSEEIARIAAACRRPWQRDLVLVLANTGLRISTGLAMAWPWVDWAAGTIAIPRGPDIKTSYVHVLGRVARDVLERRLATGTGDLVFPRPQGGAGRMSYDTARDAIDRAVARAGVRPGTPHDLRHSYGRALALAGVPVTVIQSQLGHTTLAMTLKYVATGQDHAARFVADFGVGEAPVSPPDADAPSLRRP
jgi:integrase